LDDFHIFGGQGRVLIFYVFSLATENKLFLIFGGFSLCVKNKNDSFLWSEKVTKNNTTLFFAALP
jgi:hypothetical protein